MKFKIRPVRVMKELPQKPNNKKMCFGSLGNHEHLVYPDNKKSFSHPTFFQIMSEKFWNYSLLRYYPIPIP